jgi:hypothetical protein
VLFFPHMRPEAARAQEGTEA